MYEYKCERIAYDAFEEACWLRDDEEKLRGDPGHLIHSSFRFLLGLRQILDKTRV